MSTMFQDLNNCIKNHETMEPKTKKTKKIISLPSCNTSRPYSAAINRSMMTETTQGDNVKECNHLKLNRSRPDPTTGQMGDSRLPTWHYLMEQVFESFLLKLDEIFMSLKRDSADDILCKDVGAYKDICEKLRTEILIAMDRLEFLAFPNNELLEEQSAFLNKMNKLKSQLSELRWNYHNAIKELGSKLY